nr:uncharacterized protein LOC100186154 [Ciona intestinalis]|eukprot:XP_009861041.1 uncharacterized protein LOC100186154 [Ciona intestinalis]
MSFEGKIVIVSGAASGIGAATALEFAKLKASLVLVDRDNKGLLVTKSKCTDAGSPDVLELVVELRDLEQVKGIVKQTISHFGKLNVLCNVAGVLKSRSLENETPERYSELFDINTRHVFFLTQAAMPYLESSKGCIVNVSSINSTGQFPRSLAYSMTKSAIDQLTKTLAIEYAPRGVRVNAVNPGETSTNLLLNNYNQDPNKVKEHYNKCNDQLPMKSVCMPEDIANAIVFLSSVKARMITGQCLKVDGAESMCNNN